MYQCLAWYITHWKWKQKYDIKLSLAGKQKLLMPTARGQNWKEWRRPNYPVFAGVSDEADILSHLP